MTSKNIDKLIQNLLSKKQKGKGFGFIVSTRLKKFKFVSSKNIPKSWAKIYFKLYPRFRQIHLKHFGGKDNKLFSIINRRESNRRFKGENLTLNEINKIIYYSCGIRNIKKIKGDFDKSFRMYPSAGAKYPLEVYAVVLRSKNISQGIYHFNVKDNNLELLLKGDFREKLREITGQEWVGKSALIIIITAVYQRTTRKYGERGWRYILFEAGHLSQNIYLVSTALNLKCCAIGGFLDNEVAHLLDLDIDKEPPLYLIAVGR